MHTNVVSFIILLVFLKNVASQPKLFVVDLIKKGTDDNRQIKRNEDLELIRVIDEHHKLQKAPYRDLDKFDKPDKEHKYANDEEEEDDEPEFFYDEQETLKVYNCHSLRPKDIRECLKNNLNILKGQSHKTEIGELDVLEKVKTPDECMASDASMFVQLQCLAKFINQPTGHKRFKNSEEDEFVNVRDPEDCWNLKNTRMSKKLICLKKLHEKNDETDDDEFKNLNDPNDCLSLKKTSMHRKLRCLHILKKNKVTDDRIIYDNFENIKDPNECLFLKKATMKNKLECLEKIEKNKVIDDKLEKVTDPTDCLSLKTTMKNKYKCLEKFGKANDDDDEVAVLDEDFDNLKEPNDCLFLKETIKRKLKCLDKFQKVEEMTQNAKEMTIVTENKHTLRTENDKDMNGPEDCIFAYNSYGKKIKCLDELVTNKKIFRARSVESNRQIIARPKRKIYSLYNYYNAVVKPAGFKDVTRQEFSQDYLDISELSRSVPKCRTPACDLDQMKLSYTAKEKKPHLRNKSRRFFDNLLTRYLQAVSNENSDEVESPKPPKRKAKNKMNGIPVRFTVVSKEEEEDKHSDDAESEESFEDEQDSDEVHQEIKKKKLKKKQKSSAEETAKKSFLVFESQENVAMGISDEGESPKKSNKKKKAKKTHDNDDYSIETERPSSFKYSYLQGNNVIDYFRRRLEHFLPKRFHWDKNEFTNLGYYWHDGPRGRWSK